MAILEKDLSSEVLNIFRQRGYRIFLEIPVYNRRIDAILLKGKTVYSIEFKIKNWRKAIIQIRTHMLIADFAYLCMPYRNKIPEQLEKYLINYGIGLFLYNLDLKEIKETISPRHSFIQQTRLKDNVIRRLTKKGGIYEFT